MVGGVDSKVCWYGLLIWFVDMVLHPLVFHHYRCGWTVDGTALSIVVSTKALSSLWLVVQNGAVYKGAHLLSFMTILFHRTRKFVSMAITADFRDSFYFLSLQFQIYLLFPLVIKSLGGYLQVHAVLYYVQKIKAYFSVKCWTFYQVDILQQTLLNVFYLMLSQNAAENTLKCHELYKYNSYYTDQTVQYSDFDLADVAYHSRNTATPEFLMLKYEREGSKGHESLRSCLEIMRVL